MPELDGVRGLAISLVIVHHYVGVQLSSMSGRAGYYAARLLGLTWSGVDLFFVLSGFLIGGILLDARGSPSYFRTFYGRRIFRIFPLYYAWIVLFGLGLIMTTPYTSRIFNQRIPIWSYLTFTQNLTMSSRNAFGADWMGVTWSLAVEEQFYLLLPLLIHATPRRWLPKLLFGAIAGALALRTLLIYAVPHNYMLATYMLLPCRGDALSCGVLIALAARSTHIWQMLQRRKRALLGAFCLLGAGAAWLLKQEPFGSLMHSVGFTWLALFYSVSLVLVLAFPESAFAAIFRSRTICAVGTVAYGLYIFHVGVNYLVHAIWLRATPELSTIPSAACSAAALAITVLLAAASWRYFEGPLMRRAHSRFSYIV